MLKTRAWQLTRVDSAVLWSNLIGLGLIILDEKVRDLRKWVGGGKEFLGALIRKGLDLFKKKNENRLRSIF